MGSAPSVLSLVESADRALAQGLLDRALRLVHDFVERVITEPLCTAQVFASRELDALCQRIGRHNLARGRLLTVDPWPDRGARPMVIYVLTRLQKSGGHSRLVEDFIRARPDKDHLILATGIGGPSDWAYLTQVFAGQSNVRFLSAPRGDFGARLSWLQGALVSCGPEHVYLFNHHQDSVAVAAIQPGMGIKASFYHHGDHHLCLGVHLDHLVHIDPHPMGYHHCREMLGVENVYVPLTFEDKGPRPDTLPFAPGGVLTTATAARSNKIEIPYFVSYLDLIPGLLKMTGGRHIHIGRLTPWALWRLRRGMRKEGVPADRLVYLAWTPSVWRTLQEKGVDVYIASFPYGGGITLIEAMGAGVPVVLHRHIYSRILSGLELAYPEAFSWRSPADLLAHFATIRVADLPAQSRLARQCYEEFHRPEVLHAYLEHHGGGLADVPPLSEAYEREADEWACWVQGQLGFGRLVGRTAYRLARMLRARLSWAR